VMKSVPSLAFAVSSAFLLLFPQSHSAEPKNSAATNGPSTDRDKELGYRLKWNLDTLVGEYERHGRRNRKWDESAKVGLAAFAEIRCFSGPKGDQPLAKIPGAIKTAVTNGCDDPMVRYLYARFVMPLETHTNKEHEDAYRVAAEAFDQSEYAAIRKFYAALRAAEALNPGGTN